MKERLVRIGRVLTAFGDLRDVARIVVKEDCRSQSQENALSPVSSE